MKRKILTSLVTLSIVYVMMLGSTFSTLEMHHRHISHCPFTGNEMPLCTTILEHMDHWQIAFVAIVTMLGLIGVFIAVRAALQLVTHGLRKEVHRIGLQYRMPGPPKLTQELLAQGLLNPRIP